MNSIGAFDYTLDKMKGIYQKIISMINNIGQNNNLLILLENLQIYTEINQ